MALSPVLGLLFGCVGTTGGELVTIGAFGAGPEDASSGQPYTFQNSRGYEITLTRANVHVGAMYLNRSRPASVDSDTSCFLPGVYVAEVTSGLTIDLLSSEPQPFPEMGSGTTDNALAGEVWLFGGNDINAEQDSTVILDVAGMAVKSGTQIPFEGQITISVNRTSPPSSPAQPGANPICKQRVITPIPVELRLEDGDDLLLRIEPRGMFAHVDFEALEESDASSPLRRFRDDDGDAASRSLYSGLRAAQGTYFFEIM